MMSGVYGLYDPLTGELRYVGKTVVDVDVRLREHIRRSKTERTHNARWIRSLVARGLQPILIVLERSLFADVLNDLERRWIKQMRDSGAHLTNLTEGGEGFAGLIFSNEHRQGISAAARKRWASDDYRRRMSEAISRSHKGLKKSPEHVARIAESLRGQKRTIEQNRANSERQRRWMQSADARRQISAAAIQRFQSLEERARSAEKQRGKRHTAETRAKISAAGRLRDMSCLNTQEARAKRYAKRARSPEARAKIAWAASHCSAETRAKMSEAAKHRPPISEATREKLRNRNTRAALRRKQVA